MCNQPVSGDIIGLPDVFMHVRQAGTTTLVSKSWVGVAGNEHSFSASLSAGDSGSRVMERISRRYITKINKACCAFSYIQGVQFVNTSVYPGFCCRNFCMVIALLLLTILPAAGTLGNGNSYYPSISADGRYVAFESDATNLVTGDTNSAGDIFMRDRRNGTTTRISQSYAGGQGNGNSHNPSVSSDGRFVAFESDATNFVAGDTNGKHDIFVRDRQKGITTLVSKSSAGVVGNGDSAHPSISADGRYVAYDSQATNLVAGDVNGKDDIFVRDRQKGTTTRVSKSSAGVAGNEGSDYPSISADGRYVAFMSYSSNLVAGDTNGAYDIFVRDRQEGTTTRVSKSSAGMGGNSDSTYPSLSAGGRYVAFESDATNLVTGDTNGYRDIFVRDRQTGTTGLVSKR
jgi:Tol biopolymer transport system component